MRDIDRGYLAQIAGAIVFLASGVACLRFGEGLLEILGVTLTVFGFGALSALLRERHEHR